MTEEKLDPRSVMDGSRFAYNSLTGAAQSLIGLMPEGATEEDLAEAHFYQQEVAKKSLEATMWLGHLAGFVGSKNK